MIHLFFIITGEKSKKKKKRREAKGEVEVGDAFKAQEPAAKARKEGGGGDAELNWVACDECEEWFAVTKEKYAELSKKERVCCEESPRMSWTGFVARSGGKPAGSRTQSSRARIANEFSR